jgi:hypothetical protein
MRVLWLLALGACSFPRASDTLACETTDQCDNGRTCVDNFCVFGGDLPDGAPDSARFDCTQWAAPNHFAPCDIPQPAGALDLSTAGVYTYDTGSGTLTDPAGGTSTPTNQPIASGMLISVDKLTIASGTTLRVIGIVPLVVASWTDIEIDGAIDAGSTAEAAGAGSNPTECAAHAPTAGTAAGGGGGGGGGGGFQAAGGNGGDGSNPANGRNGDGGTLTALPLLLGGCAGAKGGDGGSLAGAGGAGGGAVQLTAQGQITIAGTLNAGGSGGDPGVLNDNGGGAGGGGSGGMIGLEATAISILDGAVVACNGGGGGEGGDDFPAGRGLDGTPTATRAAGGSLNNDGGGNGGLGSGGATLTGGVAGNDNGDGGGGGGGGGSAGFIAVRGAVTKGATAVLSPPESIIPSP